MTHLHPYGQNLCLLTADQTWIWSYLLVLVHTPMSVLLFIVYYSCTHLQAVNNRMNYFAGFIIFFHKKSKLTACCKCQKALKTNTIFAVLSQEHDWLGSSKFPHIAATEPFQPTCSTEKIHLPTGRKTLYPSDTLKKANPHKDLILYWGSCYFRVNICHSLCLPVVSSTVSQEHDYIGMRLVATNVL